MSDAAIRHAQEALWASVRVVAEPGGAAALAALLSGAYTPTPGERVGVLIANKLGISQPTASEHLKVLSRAGLVRVKRIKQWTFYQRDEKRIAEVRRAFRSAW